MIKNEIAQLLTKAIKDAQERGELPAFDVPPIPLEHPKQAEHGDYATPICLQLAKLARMAPMKIAEVVAMRLPQTDYLGRVEVAPPGYINFALDEGWLARQVEEILAAGPSFGDLDLGKGRRVQVEFVSANPTGPLTVGSGRNAAIGDTLANVLAAAGYDVRREYYVNDRGTQIELFNETLYARYAQALGRDEPIPERGYRGTYMIELGRQIAEEVGDKFLNMPRAEAIPAIGEIGLRKILQGIEEDLALMGIRYDSWFSERSLYEDSAFEEAMAILRRGGYVEEREGAVWFTATSLGGGKDEVLIRSDGSPGYFASDIAYHYDKFVKRGFDWVIDVWGADHQGHVPRMKAMMQALGLDPDRLTLLVYQLVTIMRDGQPVRMGKRLGTVITLAEVLDEIGPDAVRFFLLSRSADSQMELDLELAKRQSSENPVYYIQYAHARIASILRHAGDVGVKVKDGDVSLLRHPSELALIRKMLQLPEMIESAALQLAPHLLTYYAQELAAAFHIFYRDCRVVSTDPADAAITQARLKLTLAAKTVLARVLRLMGMTTPEQM